MGANIHRLPAQHVSAEFIEAKIQFMVDMHLWPERERMDPYAWLDNFTDAERPYALHLLNVFMYFNENLVDALFRAAVQNLSAAITASATSLADAKGRWRDFLARVQVTWVPGERPRPTDSGIVFARKARQVLQINEEQIVEPQTALAHVLQDYTTPVLFVDDFVGGGNQMNTTWHRQYAVQPGRSSSFSAAAQHNSFLVYTPLLATTHGLEVLAQKCPALRVCPAHAVDRRYSLTASDSVLWPDDLRSAAPSVLYQASKRAGIVTDYHHGWQGFHDLALAVAFWHSVPDATLPLFFWDRNGWAPLIRRT